MAVSFRAQVLVSGKSTTWLAIVLTVVRRNRRGGVVPDQLVPVGSRRASEPDPKSPQTVIPVAVPRDRLPDSLSTTMPTSPVAD